MLLSYTIVDLYLFYNWAVDMQICALLTRSKCKAFDTQVTIKACGLLANFDIDAYYRQFELSFNLIYFDLKIVAELQLNSMKTMSMS